MTEESTARKTVDEAETMTADDTARDGEMNLAFSAPALPAEEAEQLCRDIILALKTVYDPEIPADVYELGLIYEVAVDADRNVAVVMTLTAPGCPVAGEMPGWVANAVSTVPGLGQVDVEMVFDPMWNPERMSDEARVQLDFFY